MATVPAAAHRRAMAVEVLLVEDESELRDALALMLASCGYSVRATENGVEALGVLNDGFRPSCIVLDMMMPVMSGREFLCALHAAPNVAGIPVIALSGTDSALDEARALGAAVALSKPTEVTDIPRVVAEHCG